MAADIYDGMRDRWPVNHKPLDNPRLAFVVTPDDNKDLPGSSSTPSYAKALYIGDATAKNIAVIMAGDKSNNGAGTAVTLTSVPAGMLNIQVRRVLATGTTMAGSSIVALMD